MTRNGANTVSVADTATNTANATIPVSSSQDQCRNGGWMAFTSSSFKNQGDCISYVNHLP